MSSSEHDSRLDTVTTEMTGGTPSPGVPVPAALQPQETGGTQPVGSATAALPNSVKPPEDAAPAMPTTSGAPVTGLSVLIPLWLDCRNVYVFSPSAPLVKVLLLLFCVAQPTRAA